LNPLTKNVVANLVGRFWVSLLGLLFIPLYLRFLGIEAYGLVGFFSTLHAVFGVLDFGMGLTLNRELARLSVQEGKSQEQRSLVRTLEVIFWLLSLVIALAVSLLSVPVGRYWLQPQQLLPTTVEKTLLLMGVAIALQFPFSLYQGALMGLQRQVQVNVVLIVTGTLRAVGSLLVLWLISPSPQAFFTWQILISSLQAIVVRRLLWQSLPYSRQRATFRIHLLRDRWRYAGSVAGNAFIGLGLTQLDKILLSKLLTLDQFGYYSLASTVASSLWAIIIPLNTALFPRFAQLVELREEQHLGDLYHRACQFMAVALLPIALTIILFAQDSVWLWTRNVEASIYAAPVVALLVAGTAVNGLVSVAVSLQSAAGWPQLAMYSNLVSAVALIPATIVLTTQFGAPGAAFVWLILNLGYVAFNVPLMHRRILKGEQRRWYLDDVAFPLAAILAVTLLGRWLVLESGTIGFTWLFFIWGASSVAALLSAGRVRTWFLRRLHDAFGGSSVRTFRA
jgi:O-antigen/teichoic acid export membrane protein